MYQEIISWLESKQMPCVYKKYLGIDCPGCGMQRAFIELLKGNLSESIVAFPALIPMMVLLIFLALHLKFKFEKGSKILLFMFIFTVLILIGNYIFKFANIY